MPIESSITHFVEEEQITRRENMPKLSARVIVSVVIGLGIVVAVFASVQSVLAQRSLMGSHLVSGAMVNLNHDRFTVDELNAYNAQLELYNNYMNGDGGGCHSESLKSPDD